MTGTSLHRRSVVLGVLAIATAGCLGDDEPAPADDQADDTDDTTTDEHGDDRGDDDQEPADGDDGTDEPEAIPIEPGTAIELDGQSTGWVGIAPDEIEGLDNPPLSLQLGEPYEIGWTRGDGGEHNIEIRDEHDAVIEDLQTVRTQEPDEDQWLSFEVTAEMASYVCAPHQFSMVGKIEPE